MKGTWEWAKEKISERKNESVKNAKKRKQASWFDNEVSTSRFYHPNTTCMLQFINKQPIRINIQKLSSKLIEWINSTMQDYKKWKIKYSQSCVV
jgi:hypothetical protein